MDRTAARDQAFLTAKGTAPGLCLLLGLVFVTAWISGGKFLLTRDLWMDEVHSWLLVTDPDPRHALQALADGADFNPPTWFLTSQFFTRYLVPPTELSLRLLSLTWMVLTLSGLYLLLARHFTPVICVTSVLLTACHPLLIHQSTEIRFYGFWCGLVVWLCVVVEWQTSNRLKYAMKLLGVAGFAALISTCHYFGILSLALIAAPLLIVHGRRKQDVVVAGLIMASGSAALASCLPFLAGQKAAISRPTWISPATLSDSLLFVQTLLPVWQIALCVIAVLLTAMFFRKNTGEGGLFNRLPQGVASVAPCACLSAMSLLIVGVSWFLQPALVVRYAIVGVLGGAPLLAILLHQCSAGLRVGILGIAVVAFGCSIEGCVAQWRTADGERARLVQQLRECQPDDVVVFEDRITWMPLLHRYPELASVCRLAEFQDSQLVQDSSLRIVQRDAGRRIEHWYPQYKMQKLETLADSSYFYVVPYAEAPEFGLKYSPDYTAVPFTASIVRLMKHR